MQKIAPFLWFDGKAEEAMNFYTSIFKNSKPGYHNFCAIHDAATRACEDVSDLGFCVIAVLPWYFVVLGCGSG